MTQAIRPPTKKGRSMPERPFFVGYSTTFVTLNCGGVYTLRQVEPNPVTPDLIRGPSIHTNRRVG
ncbi:MAG: hypothetical protein B7Y89_07135 [Novosphingobium sp. 32-60-15]|nr:MAG: hypothetical protein B7Y89_07135 [Novosphingobium sp. 32-60-15]